MNRYQVRISVVRMETAPSLAGVVGGRVPDKLLDASFTTDDVMQIRGSVDGLIERGIPETQVNPAERIHDLMRGLGTGTLPPTVAESGDVAVWKTDKHSSSCQCVECDELKGGKHSGDCVCSACVGPDVDDDTSVDADDTTS